jgi:uncharacterized protein YeaO (DUF488 family)
MQRLAFKSASLIITSPLTRGWCAWRSLKVIRIDKTVYSPPDKSDGKRILVMTLWPRGVSKDKVDLWMKELGTPRDLIRLYKAGKVTWAEYSKEYRKSLKGKEGILKELAAESKSKTITLLCTEKDPSSCHRSLLKEAIESMQ